VREKDGSARVGYTMPRMVPRPGVQTGPPNLVSSLFAERFFGDSKTDTQDLRLSCCGRPFFRPSTGTVPNACARSCISSMASRMRSSGKRAQRRSCSRRAPSKLVTRQRIVQTNFTATTRILPRSVRRSESKPGVSRRKVLGAGELRHCPKHSPSLSRHDRPTDLFPAGFAERLDSLLPIIPTEALALTNTDPHRKCGQILSRASIYRDACQGNA